MNDESIIPQTDKTGCFVSERTNIAQNAFWEAVLGTHVALHINEQGEDSYRILQVDQYFVIAEDVAGTILMFNKSAIISAIPEETAYPALIRSMANAVKKSEYKPSKEKTERNRKKLSDPVKPTKKAPEVIVKKKRSYEPAH